MQDILEYRAARYAVEVMTETPDRQKAFETFEKRPELAELLVMMHRAQAGRPLRGGNMRAEAGAQAARLRAQSGIDTANANAETEGAR